MNAVRSRFILRLRRRAAAVVLAGLTFATPATAQEYDGVHVERDVMVEARDGVLLATNVYRPTRGGSVVTQPLPALLHRTPYDKEGIGSSPQVEHFVRAGYVVVVQDMRGRYASQGEFSKYHDFDAPDGYDAVEWVAALPYVEGPVGMWGTSYGAHTQADAAKMNPPSMGPLVLNQGGMANAWDHAVRQGGAFELGRELTWAWRQVPLESDDPAVKALFEAEPVASWYTALPIREGLSPLSVAPNFEAYFLNEWRNGDYDEFWTRIGINWWEYYDDTADVPMLHIGGWYDIFLRGTVQNYLGLAARKERPQRLLIGPWTHSGNARTYAGDVDFGTEGQIADFATDFHVRWFDHFLKGVSNGVGEQPPVRIFVMGTGDGHKTAEGRLSHGGYWRDADDWPLPEAQPLRLYLSDHGVLSEEQPGAAQAQGEGETTYTHDPEHPVPTIGGSVSARVKDGAYDQRERPDFPASRPPYLPLRARDDVVVFQTEPLEEDVQVIGPVTVRLYVSSTAVDTDFTVKLVDVYPPSDDFPGGFDLNITDAMMRASYRNGRETRSLITPGQLYELTLELFPTANVFKAGHRIRLDVASSSFPRWDVNPGTGEPLGRHRRTVTADNTIYHRAAQASYVELAVVPLQR